MSKIVKISDNCPKCESTLLLIHTWWPYCSQCLFGESMADWPDHIHKELFSVKRSMDEQVALWHAIFFAEKTKKSTCNCDIFIHGCSCGEFVRNMQEQGKVYNKVLRMWE